MPMATFREIQAYVESKYSVTPHTSWIAEVKELCPQLREAANHLDKEREKGNICPKEKIESIKDALKQFSKI
jgi:hypothetical protein